MKATAIDFICRQVRLGTASCGWWSSTRGLTAVDEVEAETTEYSSVGDSHNFSRRTISTQHARHRDDKKTEACSARHARFRWGKRTSERWTVKRAVAKQA